MDLDLNAFEEEPTEKSLPQESFTAKADELISGSMAPSQIWQIDYTKLDCCVVSDKRSSSLVDIGCWNWLLQQIPIPQKIRRVFNRLMMKRSRRADRLCRPTLTVVTDPFSRCIVGVYLSRPNEN